VTVFAVAYFVGMPWMMKTIPEERRVFIELARAKAMPMARLATAFGISTKTAFKWRKRAESGVDELTDRSRRPKTSPNATPAKLTRELLRLRRKYGYGPRKLRQMLVEKFPREQCPAASTVGDIIKRNGLVRKRIRIRRAPQPVGGRLTAPTVPNSVWCVDFKGEFRLGNGAYCWPLTITDGATRFCLGCFAFPGPLMELTLQAFEKVFAEYGLPKIIRSDNGTPFSSAAIAGLTKVSFRWMQYGIVHERTRPATPSDNGRHERFHRTLKDATAIPPARDMRGQQRAFDSFLEEYNFTRPHEALGQIPPGRLYVPSARPKPVALEPVTYPKHFETKIVPANGTIHLDRTPFHLGRVFAGELIGIEELPGGRWGFHCGSFALAELDWKTGKMSHYGSKGMKAGRRSFEARQKVRHLMKKAQR
jgi:putative transposase